MEGEIESWGGGGLAWFCIVIDRLLRIRGREERYCSRGFKKENLFTLSLERGLCDNGTVDE